MFKKYNGVRNMRTDIGIDLGTNFTRIFMGKSIALCEPSVVTVNDMTGEAVNYGYDAYKAIGRTSDLRIPVCPIENGTVADFRAAELMLKEYVHRVCGKKVIRPRAIVAIPCGTTAVQQRSVLDAMESAGARNVCLVEAPLATVIGMGMDFSTPKGITIIDIGKGTTDIAVISMGGLARSVSLKTGGAAFDDAIVKFVRNEHNVNIGVVTAERLKKQIGCVKRRPVEVGMTVSGINLFSGLPQSVEITSGDLLRVMNETADDIIRSVQDVFEHTAPEMLADTAEDGIVLTGGGALTYGMAEMLSIRLSTKINMAEDPENSVVNGLGKALEDFSMLKNRDYHFRSLEDLMVE